MIGKRGLKLSIFFFMLVVVILLFFIFANFVFGVSNCWSYSAKSTCEANSKCNWHDDAWSSGWCEQLDCWSLYTKTSCQNANSTYNLSCLWQEPSAPPGWCSEADCWGFSGTNRSTCENTTIGYGLNCLWGPTDPSPNYIGYDCFGGSQCYKGGVVNPYYTESECKNISGCSWGSCYVKGCWDYATEAACNADTTCSWYNSGYGNQCNIAGCSDVKHKGQAACLNTSDTLNCRWNSQWGYCEALNCWSYNYNETGCGSTGVTGLECNWNNPWCETKSCWQNKDDTSCKGKTGYDGKNCTWNVPTVSTSGWCEKVGCWNLGPSLLNVSINKSQCVNNSYSLDCVWENNTWGVSCYQNFTSSILTCSNVTDEKKCFDTTWCWWDSVANKCNEPTAGTGGGAIGGGGTFGAPGCWIFDLNQTSCTNTTGCAYDPRLRLCNVSITVSADIADGIRSNGLNCTLLNNTDLCNGATFLPYCCEWQGSSCTQNKYSTTCWDNLKKPPEGATFCEDYNAYTSESKCAEIANYPWYMPCRWDNKTKNCEFKGDQFFIQGEEGDIDLVDNKDMCEKGVGGLWLTESYCGTGNMTNASITVGRCAQKLGSIGGNCDTGCFKCEFKSDGSNYTSDSAAREACEKSALGFCVWRTDAKAVNGLGYCEPSKEFKDGSVSKCDANNCDSCNVYNSVNAKSKCQDAKCEWKVDPLDTAKGFCASAGTTTCLDRCESCLEQKACVEKGRGINGSCTWDVTLGLCKKSSTAENTGATEICFDGIDNDGDAKIDCADGGCFTDPFCGGTSIKDCWQYANNASCVDNDCKWFNDTYGSWCDQKAAVCWQNDGDQASCAAESATCEWHASGSNTCNLNSSVWDECSPLSQSDCNANGRCYWFIDSYFGAGASKGWCGHRHDICFFNQTLMSNQTACQNANSTIGGNLSCSWNFDPWSSTGGYCASGCFSLGSDCGTNGMCKSNNGWCDPIGFGGNGTQVFNCFQFETQTVCSNQSNCKWLPDPNPMCDISYKTDCFNYKLQSSCNSNINCSWTGIDTNNGWCDQKGNRCWWNYTLASDQTQCNADPLCFWKNWSIASTGTVSSNYSSCEPKVFNSTTESQCTSVNGTWRSGWCDSATAMQMFTGMDMESPPLPLGNDNCPETGISSFSDICYFGMKDSKDNFGLGTGVSNIKDAAMCNGVTTWQGVGSGNNTAKFYWYIDSDGKTTGGCALNSNSSSVGWDLYFRYEASYVNGSVTELKKAHRCISSEWKATDIQLSAWKQKMCNEIQGGMISINKDDLTAISGLLNLSSTLRFYSATANATNNESSPSDTVGPSFFTPGSIDFTPECCWATGDQSMDCDGDGLSPQNDPECFFMINKGYILFEDCFGNGIDEDFDSLTDCDDYDCRGNQYCVENKLGVEASGYVDNIAPKIIFWDAEKYPDAVLLGFDTDEPANGSIDFYYNSSSCVALNKTLYDVGIYNNNTQKYKNWHEVELYNDTGTNSLNYALSGNKTYYYKLKVCDQTGNCAQSACSNFTTAVSAAKCKKCSFIFDMDLPSGWLLDLDLDNNGTYETSLHRQCGASAGILLNYTTARNINLRLRDNSSNTTLFFLGVRLTRSFAHNQEIRDINDAGGVKNGTTSTTSGTTVGYAGLSKEVSNKLVDKFHPKSCMIQIDKGTGSCTTLYHCDDNLANCVRRDTQTGVSLNESGSNYCIWKMPCVFSTYAGGTPGTSSSSSSSSSSSGGGSGGGGGGGGGGAAINLAAYASIRWDIVKEGTSAVLTVKNEKISVSEVKIDALNTLSNVDLTVEGLESNPLPVAASSKVYQYLKITEANIVDSDASKITISFKVPQSWLAANFVNENDVVLLRYSEDKWNELQTAKLSSDVNYSYHQSTTPGFSVFAIGSKETSQQLQEITPSEEMQEISVEEDTQAETQPEPVLEQETGKRGVNKASLIWVFIIIIVVVPIVYVILRRIMAKRQ